MSGAFDSGSAGPSDERGRFLRSAGSVSAAVGLSRITGLAREMLMARLFGASAAYDAFLLAFRIPNLSRDLFAEGALSAAFIPTFSQYLAGPGKRGAAELSNIVATAIAVATGAICVAGIVFSPQLVWLLAPGFAKVPGKFELAVTLTRIMFPFLTLVALAAQAMGVLNARGRFGVPALASTFFNIGSVVFGLAMAWTVGRGLHQGLIVSMACGVLAGGALQWLWQVPSMAREGFPYRPRLDWHNPGLRQIGSLMLPALLGNAALQINVMVNTNLASSITDAAGQVMNGPVSWLSYAFRFLQLPLGLFGVAVASATLPSVSRSAAIGRTDEFRETISRSLELVLLLTIPSSVGLAVLGRSMVAAVYQQGQFRSHDAQQTAVALAYYAIGLAGYAASKILAPAFYALNDARTPMLVSCASVGFNLAVAVTLVRVAGMGHAGLALSTSIVALAGAVALFALLRPRIGGIHGARLARNALKIAAASAVMGAVCHFSSRAVYGIAGQGKLAQLSDVAISIPLGVAAFYLLARALGVEELESLRRMFRR